MAWCDMVQLVAKSMRMPPEIIRRPASPCVCVYVCVCLREREREREREKERDKV